MRYVLLVAFSVLMAWPCDASDRRSRRQARSYATCSQGQCTQVGTVSATPTVATTGETSSTDALGEVNAERAKRGLAPYRNDPLLAQAAYTAATKRAAGLIAGHLPNDFACLPPGGSATTAGCAAWEPSWGFGACAMYDNYTYAGAAWVMGRDGRRYMHLFVR